MVASNPETVFYAGRPPEFGQSQRIYNKALIESLLASIDGELAGLEKTALIEALRLHYGEDITPSTRSIDS